MIVYDAFVGFTSCSPPPSASNFHFHSPPMSQFRPSQPKTNAVPFSRSFWILQARMGWYIFAALCVFVFLFGGGVVWPMPRVDCSIPSGGHHEIRVNLAPKRHYCLQPLQQTLGNLVLALGGGLCRLVVPGCGWKWRTRAGTGWGGFCARGGISSSFASCYCLAKCHGPYMHGTTDDTRGRKKCLDLSCLSHASLPNLVHPPQTNRAENTSAPPLCPRWTSLQVS